MTEEEFERDCHAVSNDIDIALDAHFMFEALNGLAKNGGSRVWTALQRDAQFWVTFRDTLQTTVIVTSARVFDIATDAYSIHRLLRAAEVNFQFFSHAALRVRKQRLNLTPAILDEYFTDLPEPDKAWIARLRDAVKPYAKQFRDVHQPVRSQVYAHRLVTNRSDIEKLFAKTNRNDLGACLMKANEVVGLLNHLFLNGHEPVLGNIRHDRHRKTCAKAVENVMERLVRSRAKLPK